ncbi:LysR substrate-binding domain-containing protein [Sulfitobacter sp. F26169L]|uniref:LysR substrate-binding domain-containing protein n=1 Tax=Sulfitobacter sp. F26169L TaxID=2996015 RepID=UPI0022609783|nr:LysR substrate-binding domain-containing protein [Sulfitobacter sp. F26169L]MCX7564746.1 LysR substrate-binding domain-containing protein [Sulfitobacter sp. F26169L]
MASAPVLRRNQRGRITFRCGGGVRWQQIAATYLLPPMLAGLHAAHPAMSIELVASDKTENLLRFESDLAVRMYRPTQNDMIARKVAELPLGVYANRRYLDQHDTPETPQDLLSHAVIGYDRSTLIIDGIRRMGLAVDPGFFAFRSDDQVVCWRRWASAVANNIWPETTPISSHYGPKSQWGACLSG